MDTTTYLMFLTAGAVIVLAPGPAQALTLARSISSGSKAGIMTALGLNIGTIVHALAAALGLSAVLATSALAFSIVKYLGAAYLFYLGVVALFSKEKHTEISKHTASTSNQAFTKAIITGILNPKVALFFLAFLPQFIDIHGGAVFLQFIILGMTLAIMDILYESILALAAGILSRHITGNVKMMAWRQRMMGCVLLGLGIRLALSRNE